MPTVAETELEQKTSEYINFIRDFYGKFDGDYTFNGKREGFKISIFDRDVTVEFRI